MATVAYHRSICENLFGNMAANNYYNLGFLDPNRIAFLACDIQEVFRKGMTDFDQLIIVANRMAAVSKILNIPMYVSEHNPKGLGRSAADFNKDAAILVYDKTKFSMATPTLMNDLEKRFGGNLEAVVLFGLEAHICVEQTAMEFLNLNIAVHILADGCISRSKLNETVAIERLRNIGCQITTSESVLFKLVKDREHPDFLEVSKLVHDFIPG